MKPIYLGADHAGYRLKEGIKKYLQAQKILFIDLGNDHYDKNDDYPDFAKLVAAAVVKNKSLGFLFCGSGAGMCIVANKTRGVRAVELKMVRDARITRAINNANIGCMAGGATINKSETGLSLSAACKIIHEFIETKFSDLPRHKRRLKKIESDKCSCC